MKKYFGLLVIIAILSGCAFGSISQFSAKYAEGKENVVPNSSFEQGKYEPSSVPEGWVVLNDLENNTVWDDEIHNVGGKCLKVESSEEKTSLISDGFSINPQAVYYSRCYIKSDKPTKEPVKLHFFAFDKNGKKVNNYSEKVILKQGWNQIELTTGFFNANASVGRIAIAIPEEKGNVYWVDDVESYNVYKFAYRYQTD